MRVALITVLNVTIFAALVYLFAMSLPAGHGHSIAIGHSLVLGTTP